VLAIDFITAFGRLLRDGNLRDVFALNPQHAGRQIYLRESDLPAWLQLDPADVEFQAEVLLRKRLDLVKWFAPETCRRLDKKLWPVFRQFARGNWPPEGGAKLSDTLLFCQHLRRQLPGAVAASEWNRLDFAHSKRRLGLRWVQIPTAKMSTRRGLQFFIRGRSQRWWEFFLYLGV